MEFLERATAVFTWLVIGAGAIGGFGVMLASVLNLIFGDGWGSDAEG